MVAPQQCLDHLILFVPANPTTKLPQVPPFFSNNFTLSPGGFHADGATSNVLILLADGCYIELISFINPSLAAAHWWGPDANFTGWKDWCLTNALSPEKNHAATRSSHAEPIRGGRKRADGVDVAWAVTFPRGDKGGQGSRGKIPFFCHDVTPRSVRVPLDEAKTTHSCGAVGVKQITVIVRDQSMLDETKTLYEAMVGSAEKETEHQVTFKLGRVQQVGGVEGGAEIVLRLPHNDEEQGRIGESGFLYGDVVLTTKAKLGNSQSSRHRLDDGEAGIGGLWLEHE